MYIITETAYEVTICDDTARIDMNILVRDGAGREHEASKQPNETSFKELDRCGRRKRGQEGEARPWKIVGRRVDRER